MGLTRDRLQELLEYDPKTGVFTRRAGCRGHAAGEVAGSPHRYYREGQSYPSGYQRIGIDGHDYLAHRLAWLYVHGEFPEYELDHKNLDGGDNRIENLRAATRTENMRNIRCSVRNTSGAKGVSPSRNGKKWRAGLHVDGHDKYLGTFATVQEAAQAVQGVRDAAHGDFARHA